MKAKPKKQVEPEADSVISLMPPRSREGAVAWLLRESRTEPMLFEMAHVRGLITWHPVMGLWSGSMFGVAPADPEPEPEPIKPVKVEKVKPVDPVEVKPPTGQLYLF
jgi:hypothetical protein